MPAGETAARTMVRAEGLEKRFGALRVLRGIDFALAQGEGTVLLGANGCGKSTLMRCLNGLERPDAGRVTVDGIAVTDRRRSALRAVRRRVGVVFQQFNLVGNLSAFQNVLYGALGRQPGGLLRCLGATAPALERARAMACLERVGLADRAGELCQHLSGGQQQRVAIARMLMQEPAVVIADEPVASLDPRAGREVMALLWEVARERGMTVLCSLHQLDLAREFGSRILGMKAGRIVFDAPAARLDDAELGALYDGAARVDAAEPADADRHSAVA